MFTFVCFLFSLMCMCGFVVIAGELKMTDVGVCVCVLNCTTS